MEKEAIVLFDASKGEDIPWCHACHVPVDKYAVRQHVRTKDHPIKLKQHLLKSSRQYTLADTIMKMQKKRGLVGALLPKRAKLLRLELVSMCMKASVSLLSMFQVRQQIESWANATFGDRRSLADFFQVHHEMTVDSLNAQLKKTNCHEQFSCCIDGTPCFASAEGVKIRVVTRDWWIREPLVRINLLKKTPNAEALAGSIEGTFKERDLLFKNWRGCMKDRAATNQAAINLLREKYKCNPFPADCNSHTISHVGEKFLLPNLAKLKKQWKKMIKFGGHSALLFQEVFGMKPLTGGGVRWWIEWELDVQLDSVGIQKLLTDVVDVCVSRKYAEKSAKKCQRVGQSKKILAGAIVEAAASRGGGKHFVHSAYWLEGDSFLAPLAFDLIDALAIQIEQGIPLPEVSGAAAEAAAIMHPLHLERLGIVEDAKTVARRADQALQVAEALAILPAPLPRPAGQRQVRRAAAAVPSAADVLRGNSHIERDRISAEALQQARPRTFQHCIVQNIL